MLPQAQVIEYDERLGHSHWIDYISRTRSVEGLIKELQQQVKRGVYLGYRIMHTYVEVSGVIYPPTEAAFRQPYIPQQKGDD